MPVVSAWTDLYPTATTYFAVNVAGTYYAPKLPVSGAPNWITDLVDSIKTWPGDVNANGHKLTNVAGGLGVGTSGATGALDVLGSSTATALGTAAGSSLRIINSDAGAYGRLSEIGFYNGGASLFGGLAYISAQYTDSSAYGVGGALIISTKSSLDSGVVPRERLRVASNGFVGIGTSPTCELDLVGTLHISSNGQIGNDLVLTRNDASGPAINVSGASNPPLRFITGGNERFRIDGAGGYSFFSLSTAAPATGSKKIYYDAVTGNVKFMA